MAKKLYPGGFRLTLKTARALAVQEFGTCKGLKQSDWHKSDGFYEMTMGNLEIKIHPDMSCSGCIQIDVSMRGGNGHVFQLHDRDTLERHYKEEDVHKRREKREALEQWLFDGGPEQCHKLIDKIWNKR